MVKYKGVVKFHYQGNRGPKETKDILQLVVSVVTKECTSDRKKDRTESYKKERDDR